MEDRALALQLALQRSGIGEVAIMGDGEAAAGELGEERLDVAFERAAGGRVAHMADGAVARQFVDHRRRREAVADEAGVALGEELQAVRGNDAGRFLAAMLQRVKAEGRQGRGVPVAEDAEHSAFLVQLVVVEGDG